jgi:hypothetical protein
MKTSLGLWAFGPMITRFVPGGYQPAHAYDAEPVAEKMHRAVKRSVIQWNFIDSVAARIDDAALREAQARKDAVSTYELVYATLGAREWRRHSGHQT